MFNDTVSDFWFSEDSWVLKFQKILELDFFKTISRRYITNVFQIHEIFSKTISGFSRGYLKIFQFINSSFQILQMNWFKFSIFLLENKFVLANVSWENFPPPKNNDWFFFSLAISYSSNIGPRIWLYEL